MLNHGDYAYAKIRYDEHTLQNLEADFQHVDDKLQHQMLWNQLFYHVMDNKMSSVKYFNFIISQLPNEQSQNVVMDVLKSLQTDIDLFLPVGKVKAARKVQFDTLMQMALKEKDTEMKDILTHHLFGAMQLDEHIQLGRQWLEKGYVFAQGEPDKKVATLNDLDKQSLMLSICKSAALSLSERNALVEQYFGKDLSDGAIENSYQCKSSYPDATMK